MARLNIYVPDELAARARAAGLNVSGLTQAAIEAALMRSALDDWLDEVAAARPLGEVPDELVRSTLDQVKDEFGGWPDR